MKTPTFAKMASALPVALILTLAVPVAARAAADRDVVMQALRDELSRSTAQLQMENLEKPYFIGYRVKETQTQTTAAEFGSTLGRHTFRSRQLMVEVRVGSPALDNTNFQSRLGPMSMAMGSSSVLSLDDDYGTLRRQIWLATDRAYKDAVEQLSRKKAVLENKTRTDETPDFSPQEPATTADLRGGKPIDLAAAESLVRELSAVFREQPDVATSMVQLTAENEITRYVNSEGTSFSRDEFFVTVMGRAASQAGDGFPVDDHFIVVRHSWDSLPAKAELVASIRELGQRISAQRRAGLVEQYNGPVLFEGQAAVEVFAQAFAPYLVGQKRPVIETSASSIVSFGAENPFLDKIGSRVLPDFLEVADDPTIAELKGAPLMRFTKVDGEGVPTHRVALVEKGRLKTLLTSRSPVRGVPRSSGSFHGTGPTPTNLIVSSAEGLDAAALKAELMKVVQQRGKEYGIVVRRMNDPLLRTERMTLFSPRGGLRIEPAMAAVKVFADGHEEPLRNVEIAGLEASAFKDILAAGREPTTLSLPYRSQLAMGMPVLVSFAVPPLLFEDVTLKKPSGEIPKPPVSKHPFFDRS